VQLGFVIDQSRCIGCHACTVACKSENQVPLGDFRTWVKYTEEGEFPEVRRSFSVLRCNQCSEPPCVTICPVTALDKHANGIVEVDPALCIGCKSCMHACPYDALYINQNTGLAEKCHFCAHRVARGLAPACAVVCPTEAIIPGDFDQATSRVSQMARDFDLSARKPEAKTQPNVFYKDVTTANIDPGLSNKAGGFLWSNAQTGPQMAAQTFEARDREMSGEPALARTTYDVPRKELWGSKITGYLFFKSIAAGLLPVALMLHWTAGASLPGLGEAAVSLGFLLVTLLLLVFDLKRPERFLLILLRPNWDSWLARGSYLILAYNLALVLWMADAFMGWDLRGHVLAGSLVGLGGLTACYTAWLFGQARGRVLWMKRHFALHLLVQSALAGSAALALFAWSPWGAGLAGSSEALGASALGEFMLACCGLHLILTLLEDRCAPRGREKEYARAARLVTHGPWMVRHWVGGVLFGTLAPIVLLVSPVDGAMQIAALLMLVGLWIIEDVFIRAGQALPIS